MTEEGLITLLLSFVSGFSDFLVSGAYAYPGPIIMTLYLLALLSAHITLLLVGAVVLENELIKGSLNTVQVHFVFLHNRFGNLV